jgi:hypothetical protein
MKESSDLTEGGITGWVIDKISNGLKWAVNRKADYQYDALIQSKDFQSLAKHYKMSEKDWDKAARNMIKKDPKKFAQILAYDLRNRKASKLF